VRGALGNRCPYRDRTENRSKDYRRAVVVNAEKEENERKRKRKTLLSEKKEVCSKSV
jgi:hypothetical protein